jgi:iron complex outermembrane receptor protein
MAAIISNRLRNSSASLALTIATMFFAAPALAQQVAANDPTGAPLETVVVTGTAQFATDAAPAKSSLNTMEPETIINRSYIENFMPPQADYVTILSIVPSMTGGDPNGPGLSDGGAKNTLRGLPDGNFSMQYDDIPFGDTNGPTHHNISYFPATTIGSINVDRGPGNAGNLGANTYGGTVKLFSEVLGDDPTAKGFVSYGSFDTWIANANAQSGEMDIAGTEAKGLFNIQHLESQGALSLQNLDATNALVKVQDTFAPNWTITLFSTYSYLTEHLDDNNGLTPAQVAIYGKSFSLQNTNPNLPTYQAYNYTTKATDFDYVKLDGQIGGLSIQNTGYTYAYWNHTFSPNSQIQTGCNFSPTGYGAAVCGAAPYFSSADVLAGNKATDINPVNGSTGDLLAYDKQNAYRVWGDVFKVSDDYDVGGVTGQVRAGIWYEAQATHRYKYYFDANQCAADNANVYRQDTPSQASAACGVKKGSDLVPGLGYSKDDEYSAWTQYEPFAEIDIRPTEDLLITPGVKYIHWNHSVNAPVEQGNTCGVDMACAPYNALGQDFVAAFTTTDTLPFLQVNYRLDTNWSVYGEYAKGIYVPDISAFEASSQTVTFPKAETTTNYQAGTVYYADHFTFDADLYYIGIANNYISQACAPPDQNDTCFINNGRATYEGVEGEGTYAFDNILGMDVTGLSMFANGALMRSVAQTNKWEPNAPFWTAALGVLFQNSSWRFSIIDKYTGQQYNDATDIKAYELPAYGDLSASIAYMFSNYEIGINADNLLNSRSVTVISEGGTGTSIALSTDQYQFQAPMSVMVTLKAHL